MEEEAEEEHYVEEAVEEEEEVVEPTVEVWGDWPEEEGPAPSSVLLTAEERASVPWRGTGGSSSSRGSRSRSSSRSVSRSERRGGSGRTTRGRTPPRSQRRSKASSIDRNLGGTSKKVGSRGNLSLLNLRVQSESIWVPGVGILGKSGTSLEHGHCTDG